MKMIEEKGLIVIKEKGIMYNICDLIQQMEGDDFRYIYIPHYEIIDLLPNDVDFEGIQGLNLDLRKEKYYREGIPVFVYERSVPRSRVDLNEILKQCKLSYYDPMGIMINRKGRYNGDNLFVINPVPKQEINIPFSKMTDTYKTISQILKSIAMNNMVLIDGNEVDYKTAFMFLYPVYLKLYDKKLKEQKNTVKGKRGRPQKNYVQSDFEQILTMYLQKEISMKEALRILNISRSTFIRRMRRYQILNAAIEAIQIDEGLCDLEDGKTKDGDMVLNDIKTKYGF